MSNKPYYSSITKKIIMSLMGLFLITFLVVHLTLNSLLLINKDWFNEGAHFMGTNAFIQIFQWVLFAGFAIHIFYGIVLQIQNWTKRPVGYKRRAFMEQSPFSKYMIYTGLLILIFLIIHLGNFFAVKMGWAAGNLGTVTVDGKKMEDMGQLVINLFHNGGYVTFYVIMFILMGFHLDHAFQSAFQTLGLNHKTYWGFIKGLGRVYAIVVSLGFIIIPLFIYFK